MTPDTISGVSETFGHPGLGEALVTGFAMMLVFEGLLYAGFPGKVKEMARQLPMITDNWLRFFGIAAMLCGIGIIWISRL